MDTMLTSTHRESWLERNKKKQRRTQMLGWVIAFGFIILIAAVVVVLLWYSRVGPFKNRP